MNSAEIARIYLDAANLLDLRDFADPVDAILAAQGHEVPSADAALSRKALHRIRKRDNRAAIAHSNLGGGVLLTNEQMAELTAEDWADIDFDMKVCPEGPARLEWAWWLRWCALDVRWASRRDLLEAA